MQKYLAPFFLTFALILLACQPLASRQSESVDALPDFLGIWVLETLGGEPVLDTVTARIQFADDGAINGNASCNRFFGKYSYTGGQLEIHPLGTTRMMCLPSLMEQETRLLELLPQTARAAREGDNLSLYSAADEVILTAVLQTDE